MKKLAVLVLCLCMIACVLSSCSSNAPELIDVKDRFIYLIEGSRELNVLFFGSGLPVYKRDNELAERMGVYYNDVLTTYDSVREDSGYVSISDIKEQAEKIYSSKYLEQIYESAIDGIVTGEGAAYLRFYENEQWLYQDSNAKDFGLAERIYDYSTMTILPVSDSENVTVTVDTYTTDDPKIKTVSLSFIFENGNWYLDSPTY